MELGALIVTTGLPGCSGIEVLLPEVGTIPAGQRMIASFQRAGVSLTGLVVGQENKKAERVLAQNGVIFLHCQEDTGLFQGVRQGLTFLKKRCERVFVVTGNTPLFLPQTLLRLLESRAALAVPEYAHSRGFPLLLSREGMDCLVSMTDPATLEEALEDWPLSKDVVSVPDPGVLLHGEDMPRRKNLIRQQSAQLARPVVEISLQRESLGYDARFSALLHLVEETHSVRDACSLMQLSYSSAWAMLSQAEDQLGFPLIRRARGGSTGSSSELTEKGRRLMEAYDRFTEHLQQIAEQLYQEILPES